MQTATFAVTDFPKIKYQLLIWANRFSSCSFLDNHQYASPHQMQECLVAAGSHAAFTIANPGEVSGINTFIAAHSGKWIFGHFSYDYYRLMAGNNAQEDETGFAPAQLTVPQVVVKLNTRFAEITSVGIAPREAWNDIQNVAVQPPTSNTVSLHPVIGRQQYLDAIQRLKDHIHRGDCYEINFCQQFIGRNAHISPTGVYQKLAAESPNPFSCFYKNTQSWLLCASPERFISRRGDCIFSQPIKGTAARNLADPHADERNASLLRQSQKERSENVMVVDLVRNDLSMICREGTVQVDELFGIYTYPQVHQMISTIRGQLRADISFPEILAACFPMGSMTGAPKKRVMELIEYYESGPRGIFSGTVGYIAPNGDFDFNVVIRSLMYNEAKHQLSYWVGSGITWYCNAEEEYNECLLKATAIKKVLEEEGKMH